MSNTICIKPEEINTDFSQMRLQRPGAIARIEKSMSQYGQLTPVIVRKVEAECQLVDGFKRYYAAVNLGLESLQARQVEINKKAAHRIDVHP